MSIFGTIVSKIFGSHSAQAKQAQNPPSGTRTPAAQSPQQQGSQQQGQQQGSRQQTPQQQAPQQQAPQQQSSMQSSVQQGAASGPIPKAQVEEMIRNIATKKGEKSNWNESIVDLLKLLDIDSSLAARKQLARELDYTGPLDGSAEMNIWLHRQVIYQLAENGGKVPDNLKD